MKKVKIILQQDVNYLLSRYEKKGELKSEFKNITISKGFWYTENCNITPFDGGDRATMCLVNHSSCNCEVINKAQEPGKWRPCDKYGLRDVRIVKKFLEENLSVEEKKNDPRWEAWGPTYSKAAEVVIEEV